MAHGELTPAPPARAGLHPAPVERLAAEVAALPGSGWCAAAVVAAGRGPHLVLEHAAGFAVRDRAWAPEAGRGVPLPPGLQQPAHAGTRFDLASLTKLFTAVAAVQQAESGALDLGARVAAYVPEFGARGKDGITVRQLLTHTSGLRPELPLYTRPSDPLSLLWEERPLPGPAVERYSDLNLIALQQVLERRTGAGLDTLVREGITGPLGMTATAFGPLPAGECAATEDQRRPWAKATRGMLRGTVHDENAWALGGVAGHAGLFSTARDLAVLCRALLGGGTYGGARILGGSSVARLLEPPGLGFQVDRPWFMGGLAGPGSGRRAAGHTGFTGTSLVLDPVTDTFLVLLATTVHPVRRPPDNGPRRRAGTLLARAAYDGAAPSSLPGSEL